MFAKFAAATAALTLLAPAAAQAEAPGPIDPGTGKIAGFTYGEEESNSYSGWLGMTPWIWTFSMQHIGYGGTPTAGVPFYLHAHTAIVSPDAVGDVLVMIDEDAGGLPLRYAPSSGMPAACYYVQFDPLSAVSPTPCRDVIEVQSGQILVSKGEPLSPGFGLSVLLPVVVDSPTSGNAAMTAMWATPQVRLTNPNLMASVPVTVAPNPNPPTTSRKLPKALKKYPKVKSLTPKVCKVQNRKVVVRKSGLCKLKGVKKGNTRVVKLRF